MDEKKRKKSLSDDEMVTINRAKLEKIKAVLPAPTHDWDVADTADADPGDQGDSNKSDPPHS